ncbi:MAG: peptidoglycan-binding domain-containing protein [bacterium]|nr:peptidoglycan-binding domain-containing protein [bacterium]
MKFIVSLLIYTVVAAACALPLGVFALVDTVSAAGVPSRQLELGMQGEEVRKLQQLLASDSALYPEGLVTGYFGSRTQKAVERFQIRHGIVNESDGPRALTGFGRLGPRTLAKLQKIVSVGGVDAVRLTPQEFENLNKDSIGR